MAIEVLMMSGFLFLISIAAAVAAIWGEQRPRMLRTGERRSMEHVLYEISPVLYRLYSRAMLVVGAVVFAALAIFLLWHYRGATT